LVSSRASEGEAIGTSNETLPQQAKAILMPRWSSLARPFDSALEHLTRAPSAARFPETGYFDLEPPFVAVEHGEKVAIAFSGPPELAP